MECLPRMPRQYEHMLESVYARIFMYLSRWPY